MRIVRRAAVFCPGQDAKPHNKSGACPANGAGCPNGFIIKEKMKLITRDTDYAIRALCYIAKHKKDLVTAGTLTRELKTPRPFLRKILQILNKEGLLKSYKGKDGGFMLTTEPADIYLLDLMKIFQGKFCLNECFLKRVVCPNIKTCILKKKIDGIQNYIIGQLKGISLKSILRN